MKKFSIYFLTAFLFLGCSFKTPPNQWQYDGTNAYESYKKNFLAANESLAKNDLARAVKHAKVSANLNLLARIYLGECALNLSVGIKSECTKYQNIKAVITDKELESYYRLLRLELHNIDISSLPKDYRDFARHVETSRYKQAAEDILAMENTSSKLLAAALIKEHLNNPLRYTLIETASFHGYKKAVLFWLNETKHHTLDGTEKEILSQKISILLSKD
ncbi:hypothetical protein KJ877_10530 [bacterium]|nr:hypothetical protein [bacterium]MBU1989191.1 hypothetical protein [bacterium]